MVHFTRRHLAGEKRPISKAARPGRAPPATKPLTLSSSFRSCPQVEMNARANASTALKRLMTEVRSAHRARRRPWLTHCSLREQYKQLTAAENEESMFTAGTHSTSLSQHVAGLRHEGEAMRWWRIGLGPQGFSDRCSASRSPLRLFGSTGRHTAMLC